MKTNFVNVSQTGQDFKRRLEYKEIKITGKDIEDSKKEFQDIRHDHKNAHFELGKFNETKLVEEPKLTSHTYGEVALA